MKVFAIRTSTILLGAASVLAASCSISTSSESLSDSVSSPFEMVSSSSDGDSDVAYRDDVSDHTRTVLDAGGSATEVTVDLGALARRHGITDWEAADSTYIGIGRGFALAGAAQSELATYRQHITDDARRASLIQAGFDFAERAE